MVTSSESAKGLGAPTSRTKRDTRSPTP
jgi:hypothetical protein